MDLFNGRNPSHMRHDFSKIPMVDIPRSMFRRDKNHKTTFDAGKLIPIFCDEVLPGDTFNLDTSIVARLTTPIVPIMDNIYMDVHYFFVPNRLVWTNFQKFMGEKDNPDDTTEYVIPEIDFEAEQIPVLSNYDYMGLPTLTSPGSLTHISALPFRALNLIYNEWYRDQNLQDSLDCPKDDGPDSYRLYEQLLPRGKRHDYFTSCLPWPQKGEGVDLPLGDWAPVLTKGALPHHEWNSVTPSTAMVFKNAATGAYPSNSRYPFVAATTGVLGESTGSPTASGTYLAPCNLWADLRLATASSINSLREAFQLQRMLERDARGGTRYIEILLAHFGITSPDYRLQRPEYLGGGTLPVQINSVPQTSVTSTTPQGNMAAYGFASGTGIGFQKAFVEHGYIIGLASVRADLTYQNGLHRMWSRRTKYDFYWPALAHLGEQEVLNKEIFFDGSANDELVFGYQERWAELRYNNSMVTGVLRSNYPTSLDVWHLAQDFSALPELGPSFIEENPPIDRVVAVPSEPHFVADIYFRLNCARPMPIYSVPGLIDHF